MDTTRFYWFLGHYRNHIHERNLLASLAWSYARMYIDKYWIYILYDIE